LQELLGRLSAGWAQSAELAAGVDSIGIKLVA
ncbi:MAG: hypothetical protein RLZZ603_1473, partial [Actinomycetota bacterium]